MKVFISADMEGATGICMEEQCLWGTPHYQSATRLLLNDVNAAVQGAVDAGAKEIIVADEHGNALNIPLMELHPAAQLIRGGGYRHVRFPFFDRSFSAMFLIAYHAKEGTNMAILDHTMDPGNWASLKVNGVEIGEIGLDAALSGAVGVPVVLVTGDDKACREAKELLGPIETVAVKKGFAHLQGCCLHPSKTAVMIRQAAKRALKKRKTIKLLDFGSPVTVTLRFKHSKEADRWATSYHLEKRVDGCTLAFRCKNIQEWYGGTWPEYIEKLRG